MTEHILETKIKATKTAKEKYKLKNKEFEKIAYPFSYSVDGLDIEILSAKGNDKDLLEIQLNVERDGIVLNVSAPFLFQNPPVIHKDKVDILGSLKAFVTDTIKTQIK